MTSSALRAALLALATSLVACSGTIKDSGSTSGSSGSTGTLDAGHDRGWHIPRHLCAPPAPQDAGPGADAGLPSYATLSETGLYRDLATRALAAGVTSYRPNYELWADGSGKKRYIYLPEECLIDTSDLERWVFPVGTKVWKEFDVDGGPVETRVLEKTAGGWYQMAFIWPQDGGDAYAAPNGAANVSGTTHDVPGLAQCTKCHQTDARDHLLGLTALQLSGAPSSVTLASLVSDGRLSAPPDGGVSLPGSPTVQAALGYLNANCAHCHGGPNPPGGLDLSTRVTDLRPEDTGPYRTTLNAPMKQWINFPDGGYDEFRVVPHDPGASGLLVYMSNRTPGDYMPPLATKVVDDDGVTAIRAWIESQ